MSVRGQHRLRRALERHPRVQRRLRQLRRVEHPVEVLRTRARGRSRLVDSPVFVLSSIRSGSTLLRVMLDAHPKIRAPHELHLNAIQAEATGMSAAAMRELGFTDEELQFALWDWVLHREGADADADVVVDKTPSNSFNWPKLTRCWPHARFIILRRHPGMVAASWQAAHPDWTQEQVADHLMRYMNGLNDAYSARGGLVVRYEDLTRDPTVELSRVCDYLGVVFDPAMVDYAARSPVMARRGLGDWSEKLRSGRVQHSEPDVDLQALHPSLLEVARAWDYA